VQHHATAPDSKLTCLLPLGRGTQLSVAVMQLNGNLVFTPTSVLSASYHKCAVGFYRSLSRASTFNCTKCAIGSYALSESLLRGS